MNERPREGERAMDVAENVVNIPFEMRSERLLAILVRHPEWEERLSQVIALPVMREALSRYRAEPERDGEAAALSQIKDEALEQCLTAIEGIAPLAGHGAVSVPPALEESLGDAANRLAMLLVGYARATRKNA